MSEQQNPRRWLVLALGLLGLTAGCAAQYGLAFLIPALRAEGYSLETATLLVTAPIAGILCTLILWGAAADRWGERRILTLGLGLAGAALLGTGSVTSRSSGGRCSSWSVRRAHRSTLRAAA